MMSGLTRWYAAVTLFLAPLSGLTDVPDILPLQGILTDSDGAPIDGTVNLTFSIYNLDTGGTVLWTETHTGFQLNSGFFTVYLGQDSPVDPVLLSQQPELWLEVSVNGEPMERFQLGSLPYALESAVCRQVGDMDEGEIQPVLSGASACPEDYYLRGWDSALGQPVCALDRFASGDFSGVVQIVDGAGITVNDTDPENPVVSVDTTAIQARLGVACTGDNYVKSIDPATGAVTCAVPPDADSWAGVTCASADSLLEWNGSAWSCATDYATQTWVEAEGYLSAVGFSDLTGQATLAQVPECQNADTLDGAHAVEFEPAGTVDAHEAAFGHLSTAQAAELTGGGETALHTHAAAGIPSGAVMAFDLPSCPIGWTELTAARGRVIVGLPLDGTRLATVGTALSDQENRAVGEHQHSNSPPQATTSDAGGHTHSITDPGHTHTGSFVVTLGLDPGTYTSTNQNYYNESTMGGVDTSTTGITVDSVVDHQHTVTVPTFQSGAAGAVAGTNAPYIQLLYCRKN